MSAGLMKFLSPEDLAAVEYAERATAGPWTLSGCGIYGGDNRWIDFDDTTREADHEFVCDARTSVPRLAERLAKANEAIAEITSNMDQWESCPHCCGAIGFHYEHCVFVAAKALLVGVEGKK